ncbi:MAG: thiosulfate oxidation carrier protein SoxY [Rhodospirillales bacterium]|nr:thiosulfate oxidation carrier protein SoxY [Rhodospirillales bacterium]
MRAGAAGAALLLAGRGRAQADAPAAGPDPKLYPTATFQLKDEAAVLKALFGKTPTPSAKIAFGAPEIAENGAVVPITLKADLPSVTKIAFLVLDNPYTLAAEYILPEGTIPDIAARLKLAKSTKIIAVVSSGDALYSASRDVKVTLGGCG